MTRAILALALGARYARPNRQSCRFVRATGTGFTALLLLLASGVVRPGVLPEDRTDILYHLYDGGGVEIDGPSVLVRKQVAKNVSVVGNYYVDMVSSASIDVVTTASPYTEERQQYSFGVDYLHGNTTMALGYTSSSESDFDATTYNFSVSQDMFGDLTALTLSYSLGDDTVGRSDDDTFSRDNTRQQYGIGLTQVLTRDLIATLNVETITDEGFLNNPYRSVRYADPTNALGRGYSFEQERYPHTRTSNAIGLRTRYYLPYRAALQAEYRWFTDTWDIDAHTAALSYVHPMEPWTFTIKYRWHDQTGAHFFRDLFARSQEFSFRGRDKELSPLTSQTLKLAASYEFMSDGWKFVDRGTVNFSIDRLNVDYHEFRDLTVATPPGEEPLYTLDADIFQLYFSFWY